MIPRLHGGDSAISMADKLPHKRRRLFFESYAEIDTQKTENSHKLIPHSVLSNVESKFKDDDESTDIKLARLISLFPSIDEAVLLDILVSYEGCVEAACASLDARQESKQEGPSSPSKSHNRNYRISISNSSSIPGIQTSLLNAFPTFTSTSLSGPSSIKSSGWSKPLTRRGKTLYLYSPKDIASHTPCSIIHNFLPPAEANDLLTELLEDAKTFEPDTFQLFDRTVKSPHTSRLYVSTEGERTQQKSQFVYNGTYQTDVRKLSPRMQAVSKKVRKAVNEEVQKRIQTHYPGGQKLKYQSPREWVPNAAFVNCYDGPQESVGYHSDQLTYLGPRAIIGSLSLGVAREFRVRKIVARDGDDSNTHTVTALKLTKGYLDKSRNDNHLQVEETKDALLSSSTPSPTKELRLPDKIADAQGQISIHLPHNSLLVMHAEMQEEWKHSIPTASTISPHPISGNRRINVTYRWYRESLNPQNIPRCHCNLPTILRCVQRKQESRGRYMWMCYAGYSPGSKGCTFFQWAQFDDDGEPVWDKLYDKKSS